MKLQVVELPPKHSTLGEVEAMEYPYLLVLSEVAQTSTHAASAWASAINHKSDIPGCAWVLVFTEPVEVIV